MNLGVQMFLLDSAFLYFYIYPEVELLDHRGVVFLSFRGTATLFPTAAIPFHIPTNSMPELPISLPLHQHLLFSILLTAAILMGTR